MQINTIFLLLLMFISHLSFAKNYSFEHPENLYNKSIDYYEKKDLGHAMYYIKKAILLTPDDPKIRQLFYDIRKDLDIPAVFSSDTDSNQIFYHWIRKIPQNISALFGSLLLFIGSILLTFLLSNNLSKKQKKYLSYFTILIFFSTLILIIHSLSQSLFLLFNKERIIVKECQTYEEPSLDSYVTGALLPGSEIKIIDQNHEFYMIKTLDGKETWIEQKYAPTLFDFQK